MTLQQVKDLLEAGFISEKEAQQQIDIINMGSDTKYYVIESGKVIRKA